MNEQLTKIKTSFTHFWTSQSKTRKIIYISAIAAIVIIAIVITALANRKEYAVLFQGLETTEASEVAAEIQGMGYEVMLKSGGTVMVPKGTEDGLTMSMAQLGYPKSNLTYELYTKNVSMFTTESEKKEYARMALESRLSAVVGSLEGVTKATVTLSIPEQKNTVISTNKQYPTAAVVVYLDRTNTLTNDQIKGITHIVQMSLSGLTEENISIVDGYGIPQIIGEESIDVIAEETRKFAFKTNLENDIKQKVLDLFVPVYGDDGVSVAVNMVLNYDDKVSENTVYSPSTTDEKGMLQHADADSASGNTVADGGVAGVEPNADDTYPTGTETNGGQWSESSVSNTYLVNTYKEQVEKAGYTIDNMSISVIVYTDYLSDPTKTELVSLVANAGSINPELATSVVTVSNLPKLEDQAVAADGQPTYLFGLSLNQLLIIGGILIILLIVLIVGLVIMSNRRKAKRKVFEEQILQSSGFSGEEGVVDGFFNLNGNSGGEQGIGVPSLMDQEAEESKETVVRKEISNFSRQCPDIVAQLLRNWLREGEEGGK